jgi:hypothetical protein
MTSTRGASLKKAEMLLNIGIRVPPIIEGEHATGICEPEGEHRYDYQLSIPRSCDTKN